MSKRIAKTAEFLEGFVLSLFWSRSSFEEKPYLENVQWHKKSIFNSLEIDQMLHSMQQTVLIFQVIECPPTPLLEILKKVTLLIHKQFMFWAVGCTDNLTAPTIPDLTLTPKATWKFSNEVLLSRYVLQHLSFIFVLLLQLLFIKYLSLVDQQALAVSLSLSFFLPSPTTSKHSKHLDLPAITEI